MKANSRSATALVSRDAIAHNLKRLRDISHGARILAVVKANAYGHGIAGVAFDIAAGTDALAVASVEEGVALRELGVSGAIVVLEGARSGAELEWAMEHRLELVVHCEEQVDKLEGAATSEPLTVWFKIDTGMNRLGFRTEQAHAAWDRLRTLPAVGAIRLMTHLAKADLRDDEMTPRQLTRFETTTRGWPGERSIANSAGLFAWKETHADWVRPGLALYGVSPFEGSTGLDLGLKPVMTLKASLIAVRDVARGETVGYGGAWTAPRATRLGVVGIGYGDGYPRHAGEEAVALVEGVRCPIVGRVSMDMLTVDLNGCPGARVGAQVTCWGEDLPVEEVAKACNTIPWTLLCGVTARVKLEYV